MRPWVFACMVLLGSMPAQAALADEPPKTRIKSAAEEFDEGRRAFLEDDFENAAVHFENAYHDAPRPEPLRHAIRSRDKAHASARAATLAEFARTRYASDAVLLELAQQVLAAETPKLLAVTVKCDTPCSIAVDGRLSSLDDARETKLWVDPGEHALIVTFEGDRNVPQKVQGAAGDAVAIDVVAPPMPPKPKGVRVVVVEKPKPFNKVPFIVGASVTAAVGALTAISYVVAKKNPGEDAVRTQCVGLGEDCPAWKDAKSGELRTNVGIFATAGLGVATAVVGLFFTRWSPAVAFGADTHGAAASVVAYF